MSCAIVVLMAVLSAVSESRVWQRASDNPFLPLVPVGQALDGAFARFLSGQPAAEVYPPFREPAAADAAAMRAALQRDRVTRIRSISTEFELVLRRDGRDVFYLRTGLVLGGGQAALVSVEGRPITAAQPLNVTSYPLTRYARAGEPYARTAVNFLARLSTGNCGNLPWADPARLTTGLPEEPRRDLADRLASSAHELPSLCASINQLDPTDTYLRLDDVAHVAMTADGRATGVIRSQFEFTPSGELTLQVGDYRPLAK